MLDADALGVGAPEPVQLPLTTKKEPARDCGGPLQVMLAARTQVEVFGPSLYQLSTQFSNNAVRQTMDRYANDPEEKAYYNPVRQHVSLKKKAAVV